MDPLTREWVDKAEADYWALEREAAVTDGPFYDLVCFRARQCSARLRLVTPFEPAWEGFTATLGGLTDFAVGYRYPGVAADADAAREAVLACRLFRAAARRSLALDISPEAPRAD